MEKYLLFGFNRYYPRGGLKDLAASFNDTHMFADALCDNGLEAGCDFYQLLDTETMEIKELALSRKINEYLTDNEDFDWGEEDNLRMKFFLEFLKNDVN